ncbi:MAG: sulfatase-like hydrolase/transferase [Planctomycetota bacterium]
MASNTGMALSTGTADRPNIIWIVADDLGYNDLSCMGQENFQTPCIDRMAEEGIRFTQFYAGCTVCAPSRACFLTGYHTGHVYQRVNGMLQFREDPLDMTIATMLKEAGYSTAMIGKSGLSCNSNDGGLPNRKGFDYFFGYTSHREAHRYFPEEMWRNGEAVRYEGNEGYEGVTYSGDEFLRESLQWIEANREQPFFLHLSLQQPHADLQVPDEYRQPFIGQFEEKPHPGGGYRAEENPKATFVGMLTYLDATVGKVVEKVEQLGLAENTVIMFTSDNGPHYEGGAHPDNFDSNGPLRGGKRDLYEGGIRVPLIAWAPGRIAPGSVSDHICASWDFPATACELAGATLPEGTDSISMVPSLTGQGEQQEHEYLYWEFYERGGKQAVRAGDWKAIKLQVGNDPDAPIRLFNLARDPGETTSVADRYPHIAEQLAAMIEEAHTSSEIAEFRPDRPRPRQQAGNRIRGGKVISRSGWSILSVSSESTFNGRNVANMIDNDASTFWHSQWREQIAQPPHEIVIDLGRSETITGIRILGRQDGQANGNIKEFDFFVSDSEDFDDPAHSGAFADTARERRVQFGPVTGRYVKFIVKSEQADQPFASIAELNLETE